MSDAQGGTVIPVTEPHRAISGDSRENCLDAMSEMALPDFNRHLGRAVRTIRHGSGLSQGDLAARIGCTRDFVSRVERAYNGHGFGFYFAVKLAAALGCTLDELVDQAERERRHGG